MIKVYKRNEMVFEGSVAEVAKKLGISRHSLYAITYKKSYHIPRKAKADFIIFEDVKYGKKPRVKIPSNRPTNVVIGTKISIKDFDFEVVDIKQDDDGFTFYTLINENHKIELIALKPYEYYNTFYRALERKVKKL